MFKKVVGSLIVASALSIGFGAAQVRQVNGINLLSKWNKQIVAGKE